VCEALAGARRVVVLERALAPGSGGIVTADVRAALGSSAPGISTVIAGLGGRAVTKKSLRALLQTRELPPLTFLDLDTGQTGSFAVGNRLLTEDRRSVQSVAGRSNALTCGHRACQGCGEALGARYALDAVHRATGGKMIAVNATGCLEVFSTPFPETSWQIAWLHSLFGNAPAVASGVAAALKAQGRTDIRVVGQGGDGGTVDIGFACLSGMFERNDDVLYICYDNQAYMNTGVQRSGATPPAARTATTQAVGREPGNRFGQGKNVPLIAMAHEIPYVATATVADLRDLEYKATRAMDFRGARYLHILVPCPLGWAAPRRTRSRWPGWPPRAACSRCSRPRPAR